jgi:hypothetical protein
MLPQLEASAPVPECLKALRELTGVSVSAEINEGRPSRYHFRHSRDPFNTERIPDVLNYATGLPRFLHCGVSVTEDRLRDALAREMGIGDGAALEVLNALMNVGVLTPVRMVESRFLVYDAERMREVLVATRRNDAVPLPTVSIPERLNRLCALLTRDWNDSRTDHHGDDDPPSARMLRAEVLRRSFPPGEAHPLDALLDAELVRLRAAHAWLLDVHDPHANVHPELPTSQYYRARREELEVKIELIEMLIEARMASGERTRAPL